jgi:hypothetical protein
MCVTYTKRSHIVAGVLALAAMRLFFRMKSEEEDFLYLRNEAKKGADQAAASTKKSM